MLAFAVHCKNILPAVARLKEFTVLRHLDVSGIFLSFVPNDFDVRANEVTADIFT